MATARDLLKNKGNPVILSISPSATALDAMQLMAEHNVGALLVEATADKVQGIVTERDIAFKLDLQGRSAKETLVSEIMTDRVLYVESSQHLEECMEIMNTKNIRHLPVYEGDELLGLISIRDVLRGVIAEQKTMISHLEHYISGGGTQ
jgi:CBS domain-containing protein